MCRGGKAFSDNQNGPLHSSDKWRDEAGSPNQECGMDRLASMAAFVKAAESGSFATTASALGISPQMVAKHVTYLEARLGARLLNRTTRKQSLTVIGKSY